MFYQIFLSPQVKRWANVTYKRGIYEFPHKLPKNLRLRVLEIPRHFRRWGGLVPTQENKRLRILENYEISGKSLNFIEL